MSSTQRVPRPVVTVLRIVVILALLGQAWEHLRWDPPYRALLWNQSLLGGPYEALTGNSWNSYVSAPWLDPAITRVTRGLGLLYLALAAVALLASARPWPRRLLYVATAGLLFLAVLSWMDHSYRIGSLIERTSRWAAPALLAFLLGDDGRFRRGVVVGVRIAVALTFLGHALYALGWYETPGEFLTMTMSILGLSEPSALQVVRAAGWFDLVVVVALCTQSLTPRLTRYALLYAVVWGALTALARVWGNFSPDFMMASLEQWVHEALLRLPQAGLPLVLLAAVPVADGSESNVAARTCAAGSDPRAVSEMENEVCTSPVSGSVRASSPSPS